MKTAIAQIDRALKKLYNLDSPLSAADFLLHKPVDKPIAEAPPGALYIVEPATPQDDLFLGIYLAADVGKHLNDFSQWSTQWTFDQTSAFGIAAEEVSHFQYIAHHAPKGRGVSHLELELQGEIDRFLLTFFAVDVSGKSSTHFTALLDQFFQRFTWNALLTQEQQARYEEASRLAKSFLVKHAELACNPQQRDRFLKRLREFYRLSLEAKVTQAIR